MKIKKQLVVMAIFGGLSVISAAHAADSMTIDNDNHTVDYPLYQPQELSIDLFGSGSINQESIEHISGDKIRHHALFGGGGGVTYYFLRYLGVGGDFDAEGRHDRFVDSASGNVFLRLPIYDTGLAPYIFGGGGYQFRDFEQSFGQAGAGLEFRFCRHVGLFVDARYVIAERTENYGLGRAGVRITF